MPLLRPPLPRSAPGRVCTLARRLPLMLLLQLPGDGGTLIEQRHGGSGGLLLLLPSAVRGVPASDARPAALAGKNVPGEADAEAGAEPSSRKRNGGLGGV